MNAGLEEAGSTHSTNKCTINFAFSLAFGLLSGNSNIVRVSENIQDQSEIVGKAIERLLSDSEHSKMRERLHWFVISVSNATASFSSVADARISGAAIKL